MFEHALFLFRIQENSWIIFLLIMAAIFYIYRLVKVFCNVLSYWEIRQFYIKALKIRMVSATLGGLYQNVVQREVIQISLLTNVLYLFICRDTMSFKYLSFVIMHCPRMNYATSHGKKSRTGSSACNGNSKCAYTKKSWQNLTSITASCDSRITWWPW